MIKIIKSSNFFQNYNPTLQFIFSNLELKVTVKNIWRCDEPFTYFSTVLVIFIFLHNNSHNNSPTVPYLCSTPHSVTTEHSAPFNLSLSLYTSKVL